jgi:pimeloyl-ACP methyl ester carboxylesterase
MEPPQTRYTRSGDMHIAYQVLGEGPLDLVYIPAFTHHVELIWEIPRQARYLRRLASLGRLLLFDKRGTGMSDRVVGVPTLETRMDDVRAVMDAAESEQAVLLGILDGGALGTLFAATYRGRRPLSSFTLRHASCEAQSFPGWSRARSTSAELRRGFATGATASGWQRTCFDPRSPARHRRNFEAGRATYASASAPVRWTPTGGRTWI